MQVSAADLRPDGLGDSGVYRPDGLHLTDIIQSLLVEAGILSTDPVFNDREATFEMGFLWEEVLERMWRLRRMGVPPKVRCVEKDGILCSPDGFDFRGRDEPLHEYKLTWKSRRNFEIERQHKYLLQIKSYCWVLGVRQCILHVLFVNGDYSFEKGKGGPKTRTFQLDFTKRELWENWRTIKRHAREKGWL